MTSLGGRRSGSGIFLTRKYGGSVSRIDLYPEDCDGFRRRDGKKESRWQP